MSKTGPTTHVIIPPGAIIGIIGGGQLGRMTALAAAALGYRVHTYTPEEESGPASQVSDSVTIGGYDDYEKLYAFAKRVDIVTLEFENIPYSSVKKLEESMPVAICPGWKALHYAQNRVREKQFVQSLGIGTAPFVPVENHETLLKALETLGTPAILKTAEMGYDGKGQYRINHDTDVNALWQQVQKDSENSDMRWVLEGFVPFEKEISVVIARGKDGQMVAYPPSENVHRDGMLHTSLAPARVSTEIAEKAQEYTKKIAEGVAFIGVMAVEFFVTKDGQLLVNEFAPRPHNSGHWTMDSCITSQFEQHVRAVCGLPLGPVDMFCPVEMTNLVGEEVYDWPQYIGKPDMKVHIYGKRHARPGRKMGHVNRLMRGALASI